MATHSPSNRAALRTFVVVALSLLVLVAGGLDFRRVWTPVGVFGYQQNGDGVIRFVADGSPAAKAGMQVGDIVDLRSTSAQFRYDVAEAGTLAAGQSATFALIHNGFRRTVRLTAIPQVTEAQQYYVAYRIAVLGVAMLYVFLGAALVLLRPSLMTWGFFVYCLANAPFTFYAIALFFPYPWPYVVWSINWLLIAGGNVGLLSFALCFLNEPIKGWRLSVLRAMPSLFVALLIFGILWTYKWGWVGGPPGELLSRTYIAIEVLWSLTALFLFVDSYVRARGADRQRIRWVVVGFGLNLAAQVVFQFLSLYVPSTPIWVFHVLQLSTVIVPLTVAYAVIKHRVIDVSFVVSRTLVYGILTSLLVGAFALIDWLFIDKLKLARLGAVAEMGVAVAGGFWFNGLHSRVDLFIDAVFFRQRHKAEVQLARNAAALPSVTTTKAVAEALVAEPVRSLSLASAALFRREKDGTYLCENSVGWQDGDLKGLDDKDDRLLALIQTEQGPLSLYEHPWRDKDVPSGPAHPVLALPIIVRRELAAVVFYGSHIHGEPLDPDEVRAIAGLAAGAAAAYDHLDAEAMKREVQLFRRKNESLEAQLAEAHIQPA
ncbi:MAG: hypothetical protein M3Z41_07090 [Candidatus Eremiobacteraeota bacterium]|nr:hypothetical protein [Candidatus Eremiobacteraeota bacterium]